MHCHRGMSRTLLTLLTVLGLGVVGAPTASSQSNGTLRFVLTHVDASQGGTIRCALYANESTWLERSDAFRTTTARVNGRSATCVFRNVPAGTYAAAALHDADRDREMDQSLIGIPQEGYAISRNETDRMSEPDFDEASFRFGGGNQTIRARRNY